MYFQKFSVGLVVASLAFGLNVASAADSEEAPKVTYEDHVKPVLREHCFTCHNQNEKKGGLALDTFASTMEGGAGGEVVYDGDSGSSRLWQLMAHEDTPVMPPGQDKLADAKVNTVRDWIDGGLLENSGSKAKKKAGNALSFSASADGRPEGPAAMPETVWKQPVVVTERASAVTAIKSSPWAPLVAVAGQNQVVLYNTDSGVLAGILPFPEGEPQSLSFTRDGSYLLVGGGRHSYQGLTVLYDIRTGDRVARCGDELDIVLGSDVNDLVDRIALGGPKRMVRIHDVATGEQVFELKKHTDWVYSVKYSPDGVLVASGDRAGGLVLWEADTGRLYLDLVGHKDSIRGITWRADSNVVASGSMDGTVKLWDINNGNQIKSITAHGGGVTAIDMARDGRIVTCGKDRLVKLWDANGNPVRDFPAMAEPVLEVCFSHDGSKVIAGDWAGEIRMWNTDDPAQMVSLTSNPPLLDARLQAAKAAAEQARATYDQHAAALASVTEQLAAANSVLASTNEQLVAAKSAQQSTEANLNAAKAAADQTAVALAALVQAEPAMQARIVEATKVVGDLAAKRDSLQTTVKAQEQAVAQETAARDQAAAGLQSIDKQLADLQAAGNGTPEQLAGLQAQRQTLLTEHDAHSKALESATNQMAALAMELKAVVEPLQAAATSLGQVQKEMSESQSNVAASRLASQEAAQIARMATSAYEIAKAKVVELESQLPMAEKNVADLTAKQNEVQALVQQAQGPRDQLAADAAAIEADLAAFNGARQSLVEAEAQLQAKLEVSVAEAEARMSEATELTSKLTVEDERLKALQQQIAELQAQVGQLRSTKQALEAAREEAASVAEATAAEKEKVADRRALFEAAYVNE
jgi:predicted nuclease with TOPRIM domain